MPPRAAAAARLTDESPESARWQASASPKGEATWKGTCGTKRLGSSTCQASSSAKRAGTVNPQGGHPPLTQLHRLPLRTFAGHLPAWGANSPGRSAVLVGPAAGPDPPPTKYLRYLCRLPLLQLPTVRRRAALQLGGPAGGIEGWQGPTFAGCCHRRQPSPWMDPSIHAIPPFQTQPSITSRAPRPFGASSAQPPQG